VNFCTVITNYNHFLIIYDEAIILIWLNFELRARAVAGTLGVYEHARANYEFVLVLLQFGNMATGSALFASDSDSDIDTESTDPVSTHVTGEKATGPSGSTSGSSLATASGAFEASSSTASKPRHAAIFAFYTNRAEVGETVKAQCKLCPCPPGKKPVMIQGRLGITSNFVTHIKVSSSSSIICINCEVLITPMEYKVVCSVTTLPISLPIW